MQNATRDEPYVSVARSASGHLAVWNRRLLTIAIVFILWAASVLALHVAGPNAQAMLAGEGMLINMPE